MKNIPDSGSLTDKNEMTEKLNNIFKIFSDIIDNKNKSEEVGDKISVDEFKLVLYNSDKVDINTVILGIVGVLKFQELQAIQIATIAHHKGFCTIMDSKTMDYLNPLYEQLSDCGVPVAIEKMD